MCSKRHLSSFAPADVCHLQREQLAAIASPLRQRILRLLAREPLSATGLRGRIEDAPSNLHYHMDRLRDAGLIREVGRRRGRGAVERFYRATARTYTLAPRLAADTTTDRDLDEALLGVVRGLVESNYTALASSLAGGVLGQDTKAGVPVITGCTIRTSRRTANRLRRKIVDWLEECRDADVADGDVELRVLALLFDGPGDESA